MGKAYSCTFTTPQDSQTVETESWEHLVTMMLGWVSSLITHNAQPEQKNDLELAAKAMLDAYDERFTNADRQLYPIGKAGVELDIIKCYLRGMTGDETVAWIAEHRGFTTSSSAIGRRWKRYCSLGVARKGAFLTPSATN